jgi:hypothetical protein
MICPRCTAEVPHLGRLSTGELCCCAACIFNPLGCRCWCGEWGVAEDMQFEGEEFDEYDDALDSAM